MRIFIDFDDVIFNTKKFKKDLSGIFFHMEFLWKNMKVHIMIPMTSGL